MSERPAVTDKQHELVLDYPERCRSYSRTGCIAVQAATTRHAREIVREERDEEEVMAEHESDVRTVSGNCRGERQVGSGCFPRTECSFDMIGASVAIEPVEEGPFDYLYDEL
jgi:hypothetical protein